MPRSNLAKAYAANFLKNLQFFGAVAVPYFLDWLRVDYTRLFILQAWFLFWVAALEVPTGVVADKFGRRISVAAGCLLFGADMIVFGTTRTYPLLFFSEFLGAVGITLMSGAEQALLYDSLVALGEQHRARFHLSRYEAAGTLGLLLSLPLGSAVAGIGRYPHSLLPPFIMTAGALGLAGGMYFWMKEPERIKPKDGFLRTGIHGVRTLLTRPDLRAYVANAVTISAVTFFVFWFYQPASLRSGVPLAWLGTIGAAFNLFAAILLANSARLERAFGIKRILFLSALLPAALFVVLGLARHLVVVVPALLLLVGCRMIRIPILADLINRHIESENRATVLSAISLLERFVTFALYPVVGLLADVSLDLSFYALAAVCGTLAVLTRVADRRLAGATVAITEGANVRDRQ